MELFNQTKEELIQKLEKLNSELEERVAVRTRELQREIAERGQAEKALKASQTKLQAILNSTQQSFTLVDKEHRIRAFNSVAAEWTKTRSGIDIQEGDSYLLLLPPIARERYLASFSRVITGERVTVERPGNIPNLPDQWFEYNYTPVFDEDGQISGVCINSTNITTRKQAEQQVQRHAERMRVLAELSQAFSKITFEYKAVVELAARRITELMGDVCTVRLLSEDKQWLEMVASYYHPEIDNTHINFLIEPIYRKVNTSLAGLVAQVGRPVLLPASIWYDNNEFDQTDLYIYANNLKNYNVAAIPLLIEGNVIGTLAIARIDASLPFTQNEFQFLQQLAERIALAIHNARLHKEITNRNQELAALQEFNARLRGPLELKPLAERALKLVMEVVKADTGVLRLWKETNVYVPYMIVRFGFGADETEAERTKRIEFGNWLADKMMQAGKSVLIENTFEFLQQNQYYNPEYRPFTYSTISVPLFADEKITGVITLGSIETGHFSQEQLRFVEMIARQIGVAIQQVSQLELQKDRDSLEAVLTLARTAAHDLNQPLTILQGELDLISLSDEPPDQDVFVRMQQAITEITNKVREYQKIVRYQTTEIVKGIRVLEANVHPPD